MYIRKLLDDEYEKVIKLIHDSVHTICKRDYTQSQLDAWAPKNFDRFKFQKALSGCYNTVMVERGTIVGFLSMEQNGYLNRLYTHKDYVGRGIGALLMCDAENYARKNGITELSLDSSKTAEGFYLKLGFFEKGISVLEHNGVIFKNKTMHKFL